MVEYKKQHYVPRFLLKKFSVDDKGKTINIFNITKNSFIENKAGIKEQCYVDIYMVKMVLWNKPFLYAKLDGKIF